MVALGLIKPDSDEQNEPEALLKGIVAAFLQDERKLVFSIHFTTNLRSLHYSVENDFSQRRRETSDSPHC